MTYVRTKEIPPGSGNFYDYEVESVREGDKVRQRHVRYLGKSGTYSRSVVGSGVNVATEKTIEPAASPSKVFKMKTPAKLVASAMGMYYGGMSLDAIQQQFKQDHNLDMSESAYWNWVTRFTEQAIRETSTFRPNVGDTWVADETYMKIGKRNVYFWDLIDADTRYILATRVSFSRTARDAKALMETAQRVAGKAPQMVVTDKLRAYITGVEDTFGADARHLQGGPFSVENNTNLIERFHRTLEQRTEVFQKYQDITSIRLLTGGWLINYNFFKQHEGIGNIPPAQARTKVVPFKDWNDVVRPHGAPDLDYVVSLHQRKGATKPRVMDARLTPVPANGSSA